MFKIEIFDEKALPAFFTPNDEHVHSINFNVSIISYI